MRIRVLLLACVSFAALLGAVPSAGAATAQITAEQSLGPRVIELTISTPAFTGPTHVDVDLPVGYDSDPHRRWPVTYVLAGTMNTYATFNNFVGGVNLAQSYPSIIVSPNGDSGYWSDWYNGGAFGPPMYESYVIDQLIPLIDQHFRTIPDRAARAVMGISMGGDGAMMFAARHPDLFADAASLSGAVDTNLPYIAAAVTVSPEFQGAPADSIYGPRSSQEVRWHGHNPTDLADNLRGLDLQVRTANGILAPQIGENPLSADTVSCAVEQGVQQASLSLHATLDALHIAHLWEDYGPGCHTPANFKREISDTFRVFATEFAHPPPAPVPFSYMAIDPSFDVWGWHIAADPQRALEFMRLQDVSAGGLTLVGSGTTSVTTPPLFPGLHRVGLNGARQATAVPDRTGRITFGVDLGAPDAGQQYTSGVATVTRSRAVSFAPYAVTRITRIRTGRHGLTVCARAIGGSIRARMRVLAAGHRAALALTRAVLTARTGCRRLRIGRPPSSRRVTLQITGRDAFGHRSTVRRRLRA
ncbi:MAG TPA: alpha/beta hydrolase family protein [Solirubrobacteraceae bacterium]|nr:alpha/beta hydrolase family protein [Solirubrobacteraceae bacterium]